jgi:hypothetical protein
MAAAALPPSVQQMPRFGVPEARLSLLDRSHVLIVTPAATSATRHLVERARRVDLRQRVTLACWQFYIAA